VAGGAVSQRLDTIDAAYATVELPVDREGDEYADVLAQSAR
jgi:hypothetical protein